MPSPTTSSTTSPITPSTLTSINSLLSEEKWGSTTTGTTLTYSFPWTNSSSATFSGHTAGESYSTLNEQNAASHYGLSPVQQTAARLALQYWGNVANLKFQELAETASNVGDIRFAWTSASNPLSDGQEAWGWASYPDSYWPSGGDIWLSSRASGATNSNWAVGSGNFSSLLHEIGHALGLKHPFEDTPVLPASQDTEQYSVMSYTSAAHSLFVNLTSNGSGSYAYSAYYVSPDTPMLYDIAAIQYLYGANMSYRTGDDTYTFDPDTPFFRTLWDAGGSDTISVANFSKGCTIDLRPGAYSKITIESDSTAGINWSSPPPTPTYDGTDNLAIAYGCDIENAIGGNGNDTLIGNALNNSLTGGKGNDTLSGGAGIDTARYSGNYAQYSLTLTTSSSIKSTLNPSIKGGVDGDDTLNSIERLQFADKKIAIDLSTAGNAGKALEFIGVIANPLISAPTAIGVILSLFDQGKSMHDVSQLAIDVGLIRNLAGSNSNIDLAKLVFRNVIGSEASLENAQALAANIQGSGGSMTQADFISTVAQLALNQQHINLVGLQTTGVEYV